MKIELTNIKINEKLKILLLTFSIPILNYISANLKIYLPFTPVPITFQTFVVFLTSALFESKIATTGQILYLLFGILGLPIFANAKTGLDALFHPTAGYIFGFIVSSLFVSQSFKRLKIFKTFKIFLIFLIGNIIIYTCGVIRLSFIFGIKKSILIGVLPFIYGDLIKIIFATLLIKKLRNLKW